jgi:hypothetical protein
MNPSDLPEQAPALLTIHQLCGIFNKDRRAVEKYGIRRVVLGPGDYRYDPADVAEYIESRKEGKPAKKKAAIYCSNEHS